MDPMGSKARLNSTGYMPHDSLFKAGYVRERLGIGLSPGPLTEDWTLKFHVLKIVNI